MKRLAGSLALLVMATGCVAPEPPTPTEVEYLVMFENEPGTIVYADPLTNESLTEQATEVSWSKKFTLPADHKRPTFTAVAGIPNYGDDSVCFVSVNGKFVETRNNGNEYACMFTIEKV